MDVLKQDHRNQARLQLRIQEMSCRCACIDSKTERATKYLYVIGKTFLIGQSDETLGIPANDANAYHGQWTCVPLLIFAMIGC